MELNKIQLKSEPYIRCPFGTFWELRAPYECGEWVGFYETKAEVDRALTKLLAIPIGEKTWGSIANINQNVLFNL